MNPVTGLSLGRIAVGALSIARPDVAGTMFGLDAARNPQMSVLSRMFGVREIALGAVTLLAAGTARRNLVAAGIAVDLADAATGWRGIQEKTMPTPQAGGLIAVALGAVVSGVVGMRQD